MKYYKEIPDMECLAGDTLPEFEITINGIITPECRMELIIAPEHSPTLSVVCKECTIENNIARIQLDSDDTAALAGTYMLHFKLTDFNGLCYRKVVGRLYVHKTAKGVI